ncbi:hypothetical protein F220043C3_17800 [Enterocloster asparagiformis]|uniref:hypothetical protein n=1 Tax=Enterocloster asparagiformis TaxID=333367 RepID=UPI0034BFA88B
MIITKTPFHMSFFGGEIDTENFFKKYGRAELSTTFERYCYVNKRPFPRFFDYSTELPYSETECVTSVEEDSRSSELGAAISFAIGMLIRKYWLTRLFIWSVSFVKRLVDGRIRLLHRLGDLAASNSIQMVHMMCYLLRLTQINLSS